MNKLNLLISGGAAVAAAVAGHFYLARLESEVAGGTKIPILVASKDIPVGGKLTEEVIAVREVPESYLEERNIRQTDSRKVIGSRVTGGLRANEAVLWSDLSKYSDRSRALAGLVQQGMRAVSIDARSSSFEGLLRPGDRVDVLFTSSGEGSTRTLLQNVLVLSVGGSIARADDQGTETHRGSGSAVTLSVTVEQAQIVTHATSRGRLTLSLRNSEDIALVEGLVESTGSLKPDSAVANHSTSKGTIEHVR